MKDVKPQKDADKRTNAPVNDKLDPHSYLGRSPPGASDSGAATQGDHRDDSALTGGQRE